MCKRTNNETKNEYKNDNGNNNALINLKNTVEKEKAILSFDIKDNERGIKFIVFNFL